MVDARLRDPEPGAVTRLLADWAGGDDGALDRLLPLVYDDLRGIARARLRDERADHTLETTALVHEAWLRIARHAETTWEDRAHFFALSATVIRRVLVDHARRRASAKRGGDQIRIPLRSDLDGADGRRFIDLLALEDALDALARHDRRLERVVVYRFFGGMTMRDTAAALGVSLRTAERFWARAKAYLYDALREE